MSYNRWICSPPSTRIDPARSTSHTENAVSGGFDNTDYSALYKISTSVDGLTGLMFE